jgi:hypothetical protein
MIRIDRLGERQNRRNPAAQSHGSKVIHNLTRTARLPIKAEPPKGGDAKPGT